MAKLNRSKTLKAVNEWFQTRGSNLRIRYSAEYREYKVVDTAVRGDIHTYFSTSLVDAIETANNVRIMYGY